MQVNINVNAAGNSPVLRELENTVNGSLTTVGFLADGSNVQEHTTIVLKKEGQNPAAGIAALLAVLATAGACRINYKKAVVNNKKD